MTFIKPLMAFLVINFSALGIGSLFMAEGPQGEWYMQLEKAPWTPEGWVFGAAWTSIMISFSVYMTYLYLQRFTKKILMLFLIQFILNVSWNFLFFNQQLIDFALINIVLLTFIVAVFQFTYLKEIKAKSLLITPYLIWLCIATSLNVYISIYN